MDRPMKIGTSIIEIATTVPQAFVEHVIIKRVFELKTRFSVRRDGCQGESGMQ